MTMIEAHESLDASLIVLESKHPEVTRKRQETKDSLIEWTMEQIMKGPCTSG